MQPPTRFHLRIKPVLNLALMTTFILKKFIHEDDDMLAIKVHMASQFFSRTFNARIRIRVAHTEYYKAFLQGLMFAEGVCISDAGADTWVIRGKSWHVEAFDDHQKARLVGHDQMTSAQALPFAVLAVAWLQITPSKGCLVWVKARKLNEEQCVAKWRVSWCPLVAESLTSNGMVHRGDIPYFLHHLSARILIKEHNK